ncbi:MAG: HAD family hydrolase [Rhizonema sp. PD38]|nr:HAD family hydrolase [Rhizonema sp. PD38]
MIKALILDLDNCLAAANEVGEQLFAPAFDAISRANHGTVSSETLSQAFTDCWRHPLDWVATKYGFSEAMLAAGWKIFATTEVKEPMYGYGDLAILSELSIRRFLVTSGFRLLQESKIKALGLERLFTAIYVDAIDEPHRKGKQGLFESILNTHQFTSAEVLVVGDNQDSEIEAGNRLGIRTVQTLRAGVPRADNATFYIYSLTELKELLISLKNNEV